MVKTKPTESVVPANTVAPVRPGDYRYDVFISYAHAEPVKRWVQDYFGAELRNYLGAQLTRATKPRVFMDRWEITSGSEWEQRLGHALRESIFLVPVLSADYFRSKWCMAELDAFLSRERTQRLVTADGSGGLVRPVLWVELDRMPVKLKRKQLVDLSDYAYDNQAFRTSQKYLGFQDSVRTFARDFCHRDGYLYKPPPKLKLSISGAGHSEVAPPRITRPRLL